MNIEEKWLQRFSWRSLEVLERPQYGQHVLVCLPYENGVIVREAVYIWSSDKSGFNEMWLDPVEEYDNYRGVTHWMPMPMPPREVRKDG